MRRDTARITPVQPLGETRAHYWIAMRMAQATGVDLVAARQDGRLDPQAWAGMVTACRGCPWTGGCARWLAHGDQTVRPPPEACVNHKALAALQPEPGT